MESLIIGPCKWGAARWVSTPHGAEVVADLQIHGWNPIAAPVRIAPTHHVHAIPASLSLDSNLIPVFVSPTVAGRNVSMKKSADRDRDLSKGRTKNLAVRSSVFDNLPVMFRSNVRYRLDLDSPRPHRQ
jgi:hypothetical protein